MPKIVDHEQYRKELLSQCFDLFAEKGYAALTMRQIAKGLNVSTGTLYHYFSSKESLFEQFVREMTLKDVQQVIAEMKKFKTPLERVEAVFNFIEEHEDYFIKQTLIWVEFYQQQSREKSERSKVFKKVWKENEQILMDVVGISNKTLLNVLGYFIDGMLLHRMFEGEDCSFKDERQTLLTMLGSYLENPLAIH